MCEALLRFFMTGMAAVFTFCVDFCLNIHLTLSYSPDAVGPPCQIGTGPPVWTPTGEKLTRIDTTLRDIHVLCKVPALRPGAPHCLHAPLSVVLMRQDVHGLREVLTHTTTSTRSTASTRCRRCNRALVWVSLKSDATLNQYMSNTVASSNVLLVSFKRGHC